MFIVADLVSLIVSKKRIHYSCEEGIEKSVPRDHRLSSLGKPRDAKRWSSERIFLSYPHTPDGFLYSAVYVIYISAIWTIFEAVSVAHLVAMLDDAGLAGIVNVMRMSHKCLEDFSCPYVIIDLIL